MSDRAFYTFIASILIGIVLIVGTTFYYFVGRFPSGSEAEAQRPECQTFPETGKTVCHGFLTYWLERGGLSRHGFPISSEFQEVSDVDGKSYTVQYFERAVFEYHPENRPPYDILLSLLGTIEFRKYRNGVQELTELPPEMIPEGSVVFPQTGKQVRGIFLDYWLTNGGPLQFGYPISGAFMERSRTDGKERIVQYFERAVFEYHPESRPPDNVQVALLGNFQFERKYPAGDPGLATATPTTTPVGTP